MTEFGGCYRAQYLGSTALGTVQCVVPAITGNAPLTAQSADLSTNLRSAVKPGALGWVVFEGGDPSLPVWIGTAKPVTNDWIPWPTWDLKWSIGGYVTGGALKYFEYRRDGDMCDFRFGYKIGIGTSFPATYIQFPLPFLAQVDLITNSIDRQPLGQVFGSDSNTGLQVTGFLMAAASDTNGGVQVCYAFGPTAGGASFIGTGTGLQNYWTQQAFGVQGPWPWRDSGGTVTAWANGDTITAAGRYRIKT